MEMNQPPKTATKFFALYQGGDLLDTFDRLYFAEAELEALEEEGLRGLRIVEVEGF